MTKRKISQSSSNYNNHYISVIAIIVIVIIVLLVMNSTQRPVVIEEDDNQALTGKGSFSRTAIPIRSTNTQASIINIGEEKQEDSNLETREDVVDSGSDYNVDALNSYKNSGRKFITNYGGDVIMITGITYSDGDDNSNEIMCPSNPSDRYALINGGCTFSSSNEYKNKYGYIGNNKYSESIKSPIQNKQLLQEFEDIAHDRVYTRGWACSGKYEVIKTQISCLRIKDEVEV